MQNEILRIQGKEVDIIPNSIDRTIQINDLGSAESRESSFSQTIKLPKTSRNQVVLNFLGVSGNMSRIPYEQISVDYIVDGIPLIINGYAEVKSTNSHYEVVLYDGIIDLAEKLKNKTLSTLNYSDLNHYLSINNYLNSLNNTEGYIYALGDFGLGVYGTKIERQVPSIFTSTLWDMIFSQLGIRYEGNFFTQNQDFKSEVVTPPQGYEVQDVDVTVTPVGSYNTDSISRNSFSKDYINYQDRFLFDSTFNNALMTFGANGEITINQTTQLQLELNIDYNNFESFLNFQVYINNSLVKSISLEEESTNKVVNLNLSVNQGDKFYCELRGSSVLINPPAEVDDRYRISYNVSASISFSETSGGFLIDFNEMMGDLPQIDFIKDVMQRYGLVIKSIKGTDNYEFIQFENLLNDRNNAEDWSDKLVDVQGESYGIKYAKKNIASYEYHEDIIVPLYDGSLIIDNENAEPEKSLFKSPYTIPTNKIRLQSEPLYYHPVWEEVEEDGLTIIKVKESPIKTFRIKRLNSSMTVYYFNNSNGTSTSTYTDTLPFLSLENMSMQYFLNVYYKAFEFAISSYKEVDATFYMNLLDVNYLDLFKLKYLKQTGKYYYLNKLQHNVGGEVSKGTLIEINEFSYNLPVQSLGSFTLNMTYSNTVNFSLNYLTTYTDPVYLDPENDSPFKVKFNTGSTAAVKLYQAGVEITAGQEILVADWDVTIEDMSTTTSAHGQSFDFQIADEGSKTYGDEVGTFNVNVYAYVNQAPVANAGQNQTVMIDTTSEFSSLVGLSGSDSYDNTGIITGYLWEIIDKPFNSGAVINSVVDVNTTMNVPNETTSIGTYTIQLGVVDEFGLTDTDTIQISIQEEQPPLA